jgi:hypothetical protein
MSRPRPYEPVLSGAATTALLKLPKSRQRLLGRLLFQLAETPAQPGDYATIDEQGRPVQHILLGEFHLSYGPDHATRELRIVEIEEV